MPYRYQLPQPHRVHVQRDPDGILQVLTTDADGKPYWVPLESIKPATFVYRNHRGEISERRVTPLGVRYGSTKWHPEHQWLLCAYDLDKGAQREFAMKDIGARAVLPREATDSMCAYAKHRHPEISKEQARGIWHSMGDQAIADAKGNAQETDQ